MGRTLGAPDDPLLVSVRSGARFSMPGMMETILDIGLNDMSVGGLAKASGQERFAWDSYRRLIQMFGRTVMGVDGDLFEQAITDHKERRAVAGDHELDTGELVALTDEFKDVIRAETGEDFPQDPAEQLARAIRAVFDSWNGERARIYRQREHIPEDLGTAVNIQAMVFGNLGQDSGTGVAFTRDPATGESGVYGDYLPDAQGEDVVAGVRDALPLSELAIIARAPTPNSATTCAPWRTTTATCATSSSPSSAASSGSSRPASASAPPKPPSASPTTSARTARSAGTRPWCASTAPV